MLEPHKIAPHPGGLNTAYLGQEMTHTERPPSSTVVLLLFEHHAGGLLLAEMVSSGSCRSEPRNLCMKGSGVVRATSPAEKRFLKTVQGENCSQIHKQRQCSRRCQSGLEIIEKIKKPSAPRGYDGQLLHTRSVSLLIRIGKLRIRVCQKKCCMLLWVTQIVDGRFFL